MRGQQANLPRRKCDNCGTTYQPKQPLRSSQKWGFCNPNCKKEFHKHGGSYGKLKPYIEREIKRRIKELSPADATRIEAIERRLESIEAACVLMRRALRDVNLPFTTEDWIKGGIEMVFPPHGRRR